MKRFLLTICTVICALGGWLLGRALEPGAPKPMPAPPVAAATPAPTPPPAAPLVSEALDRIAVLVKDKKSTTEITVRVYEEMKDLRLEDFPAAIAMARDAPGVGALGSSLLAGYWAERDLEAAKKWLFALPAAQREIFAPAIAGTWGRLQPGGLFDWLESLPDDELHKIGASLTPVLAYGAPGIDPARVADLFLALPSNGGNASEFRSLFAGWARTAPAAAADKALTLPVGAARTAAVEGTVLAWARRDPQAAGAWVQHLSDAALADRARPAYVEGLAQTDPRGAVAFVAELPATKANQEALQSVVKIWTGSDAAAAFAWAEKLDDASLRGQLLISMMDTLANTDVDGAARIYTQHPDEVSVMASFAGIHFVESYFNKHGMDAILQLAGKVPDSEREALIAYAAETWSARNSDELAAWALQRPEGFERSEGLRAAVSRKLDAGRQRGIDWMHALPSTPSSDPALNYGGRLLFFADPDAAAEILGRVLNPDMGHGKLLDLTQMWLRRDAPAARLWIEKTPTLTAPEKAGFLRTP